MSAQSVIQILPGPAVAGAAGAPVSATAGAAASATESDAATFLTLLNNAAEPTTTPVSATPTPATPPAIDGALALQVLPEATAETACAPTPDTVLTEAAAIAPTKAAAIVQTQQPEIAQPPADSPPTTPAEAQLSPASPRAAQDDDAEAPKTDADTLPPEAAAAQQPPAPPPQVLPPALLALQAAPATPQGNQDAGDDAAAPVQATQPSPRGPKAPGKPVDDKANALPTDDSVGADADAAFKPAAATAQAEPAPKGAPRTADDRAPLPAPAAPSADSSLAALAAGAPRPAAADAPASAAHTSHLGPASASVAQEIVRHFDGKSTSFEVRLDPKELGRVDIRIDVAHDKSVTATVSADNPQTLKDLIGSSRDLQRALADAGLNLADNGLSFSDRRETAQSAFDGSGLRGRETKTDDDLPAQITPARPFGVERWGGSRVDMWA